MATYAEQLVSVQAAIADIESNGQSMSHNSSGASRSLTSADLGTLYKRETALRQLIAAQTRSANGGGRLGITYVTPI